MDIRLPYSLLLFWARIPTAPAAPYSLLLFSAASETEFVLVPPPPPPERSANTVSVPAAARLTSKPAATEPQAPAAD